jgi:hypothetical protein|tara:strand:- start:414 stop:614 length:201 start_codon:yes stop_codon:yes gene_type:complete
MNDLHNERNGTSVTPAMGAKITGGHKEIFPIEGASGASVCKVTLSTYRASLLLGYYRHTLTVLFNE